MKVLFILSTLVIFLGCSNIENPQKKNSEENTAHDFAKSEMNLSPIFSILDSFYSKKFINSADTITIDSLLGNGISGFNLTGVRYLIQNYKTESPYYNKYKNKPPETKA